MIDDDFMNSVSEELFNEVILILLHLSSNVLKVMYKISQVHAPGVP